MPEPGPAKKVNVAVLIHRGVELVDMNGPVDAFLHANDYGGGPYNVYTVAETKDDVPSEYDAVTLKPGYSIADCPDPDIVIVPGILADNERGEPRKMPRPIIDWVAKQGADKNKTVLSVCIGAFIVQEAGLLKGKKATTHYMAIKTLEKDPTITVIKNVRFVEDGNVVTSGGITSGIDGALHVVEQRDGSTVAQHVADIMVYNRQAPLPPYTLLPPY